MSVTRTTTDHDALIDALALYGITVSPGLFGALFLNRAGKPMGRVNAREGWALVELLRELQDRR